MWFPTQEGAVVVDPNHVASNPLPPNVIVEQVVTPDHILAVLPGNEPLRLAASQRDFEVAFTATSLTAPEKVRFQHMLQGYDEDWHEVHARRVANYTNLPPGTYTFRVKAANNAGIWNEEGASLTLIIAPYFYETTWFLALCGLLVVVMLIGAYQARLRQVRRREYELETEVALQTKALRAEKRKTEEQAARLVELDHAKSRFFANISHEFRTPLTLIIGPIRRALAGAYGAVSPTLAKQHQLMLRNSQRLQRLIDQILDLTRLETGKLTLAARRQDLVPFVEQITRTFTSLAERQSIDLSFEAACTSCPVYFDTDQMEKVVANLLSNALKFTPEGGRVVVGVSETGEEAQITVRDTGIGIPAEALPHLFDRFYQVDASITRIQEGSGIGLALAKELVAVHGGVITVESESGRGTTFTVRLKKGHAHLDADHILDQVEADPLETPSIDANGAPAPLLQDAVSQTDPVVAITDDQTTVLVVDDNADIRAFVRSILEPAYRVFEAADGAEGLSSAREVLPDLILSDVMMPEMDGFTMSRMLKQNPMLDCIPVIMLTAKATTADEVEGLETGADDYVTKPFEAEVLLARVKNLIAQRQRLRERFQQDAPNRMPPTPPTPTFEGQIRAIIDTHLADETLSVEWLAHEVGMSRTQLFERLSEEGIDPPGTLILRVRMERAALLLRQQEGTVSEVAYGVGFNSLSYFSRCFRTHFGVPPSAYLGDGT